MLGVIKDGVSMFKGLAPLLLTLAVLAVPMLFLSTTSEERIQILEHVGLRDPIKFNLDCSGWIQKTDNYAEEFRPTAKRGYTFSVDLKRKQWCLREKYKETFARCVRVKDIYSVDNDQIRLEYAPYKNHEITIDRLKGSVYISSREQLSRPRGEPLEAWVRGNISCEKRSFKQLRDNRKI